MEAKHIDFRDQISRNKKKSAILMFVIFLVFVLLGFSISMAFNPDYFFLIIILSIVISLVYLYVIYYNSDKIAIRGVDAKKALKDKYKQYFNSVEGLCIAAGIPMPELYVMHSDQINAFASGRDYDNSIICVTTGALEKLNKDELEGVLAHEIGHIASYDVRYMTLVTVMVGLISIISQLFFRTMFFKRGNDRGKVVWILAAVVTAILAPILVYLIQMAISRKREYSADAYSVKFTRHPRALIRALKKIEKDVYAEKKVPKAIAPLFFISPLKDLDKTHPSIAKRIATLERM